MFIRLREATFTVYWYVIFVTYAYLHYEGFYIYVIYVLLCIILEGRYIEPPPRCSEREVEVTRRILRLYRELHHRATESHMILLYRGHMMPAMLVSHYTYGYYRYSSHAYAAYARLPFEIFSLPPAFIFHICYIAGDTLEIW